jgi:hypothetical protein
LTSLSPLDLSLDSTDDFTEADRTFTRAACNPFSCYRGHGVEPDGDEEGNEENDEEENPNRGVDNSPEALAQKDPEALRAALEAEKRRDSIEGRKEESGAPRADDPVLFLIDKVLPPSISAMLNELLTRALPTLTSTPLLEDKVLRICLSYGHEVCSVQPEVLTLLDDFKLKKSDLLTLDEAGLVFGGFMIPQEVDEILRESQHDADDNDEYDRYGRTYDLDGESDEDLERVRQVMLKENVSEVEPAVAPLKSNRERETKGQGKGKALGKKRR